MANDLFDLEDQSDDDFGEFAPKPEVGDLKVLNEMIERVAEIQRGIKKLETRTAEGKALFKSLVETEIPQKMQACGFKEGDCISYAGIKVQLKADTYCNVPSISAINEEKDEKKRDELVARRAAGLAILEEKAPTLIKRKYEIVVDRERPDQAECVKNLLESMEDAPEWTEGLSVHPATLGKWVKEVKATGQTFTEEEEWAFGIFPKKVAKITK